MPRSNNETRELPEIKYGPGWLSRPEGSAHIPDDAVKGAWADNNHHYGNGEYAVDPSPLPETPAATAQSGPAAVTHDGLTGMAAVLAIEAYQEALRS